MWSLQEGFASTSPNGWLVRIYFMSFYLITLVTIYCICACVPLCYNYVLVCLCACVPLCLYNAVPMCRWCYKWLSRSLWRPLCSRSRPVRGDAVVTSTLASTVTVTKVKSPSSWTTIIGFVTRVLIVQVHDFLKACKEPVQMVHVYPNPKFRMSHNFHGILLKNWTLILTHHLKGLSLSFQKIIKLTLLDQLN